MTKRKTIAVFFIAVVLCSICLLVVGCLDKNKKHNVSMKIVCEEVIDGKTIGVKRAEWTFAPDVDEMHIEREYDGNQYEFLPAYEDYDVIYSTYHWKACAEVHSSLFMKGEPKENIRKYVCEKGEYTLIVYAFPTIHDDYNPRILRLYISVK